MGYSEGEALILTRVIACNNFDSTNTSRGNWKILNQGKSNHYAILRPGAFDVEFDTICTYHVNWNTVIEVWQRYVDDATTRTELYARVADLFPIMAYPKLADTTGNVLEWSVVSGGEEPEEMWTASGGPAWLRWKITLSWKEEGDITYAE